MSGCSWRCISEGMVWLSGYKILRKKAITVKMQECLLEFTVMQSACIKKWCDCLFSFMGVKGDYGLTFVAMSAIG